MMGKKAVLFSEMTPEAEWEESFNDWYNTEHIPIRMEVKGFQGARRYRHLEEGSRKYLAVYEMDSAEVLNTQEYRNVKDFPSERTAWMLENVNDFTRYTCSLISEAVASHAQGHPYDAPILYPVFFAVPEERQEEFNRWYEEDHVPTLLNCSDWLACRRYKIDSGVPGNWTHLALHYLKDLKALESEERKIAHESEWRKRLAKEDWFKGHYLYFEKIKNFSPAHQR